MASGAAGWRFPRRRPAVRRWSRSTLELTRDSVSGVFRRARVARGAKVLSTGGCSLIHSLGERTRVRRPRTRTTNQRLFCNLRAHWRAFRRFWCRNPWAARQQGRLQSSTQSEGIMRALSLLVVVRTAALDSTAVCRRRALLGCASGVTVLAAPRRSRAPQRANQISRHRRDVCSMASTHTHTTHLSTCTQARRPARRMSCTSWCARGGPRSGRTRSAPASMRSSQKS